MSAAHVRNVRAEGELEYSTVWGFGSGKEGKGREVGQGEGEGEEEEVEEKSEGMKQSRTGGQKP